MLNNQHSQPLRCHTNESPDKPVRFSACGAGCADCGSVLRDHSPAIDLLEVVCALAS